jgi:uncharacterized protein YkwD
MDCSPPTRPRPLFCARRALAIATLAIAAALATAAPALSYVRPVARPVRLVTCPNAFALPSQATVPQARMAVACLINNERRRAHLVLLRSNAFSGAAAAGHSLDMVTRRYFAHETPEGATPSMRLLAVHYITRAMRWYVGENLAWGESERGTPYATVRSWMLSPPHRANILRPMYREMGVGVVPGTPTADPYPGATYAVDFGARG